MKASLEQVGEQADTGGLRAARLGFTLRPDQLWKRQMTGVSLGLKPTTLESRIKKLGLFRPGA